MYRVLGTISFGLLFLAAAHCRADEPNTDPFRPAAIDVEGVPTIPADIRDGFSPYNNSRYASFQGWGPIDQGLLIRTRFGNVPQLHHVQIPGGQRTQMTFLNEPVSGRFLPGPGNDDVLLLEYSAGGSENDQIVVQRDGVRTMLTDGKSRNGLGPVAENGTFFVFTSNMRNPRDSDVYLGFPNRPGEHQMVYQVENETWFPTDLSPDGTKLLMIQYVSINESHPAILDLATKEFTRIPLPKGVTGKVSFGSLKFSRDSRIIYAACDAVSEFRKLAQINLDTFEYTWLTSGIDWNVEDIEVDPRGTVALTVNEDGAGRVYLLESGKLRPLELPLGVIDGVEFSPDGEHLGMTISRPTASSDVYSVRLSDGKLTRWTESEMGGLDPSTLVEPQRISYESFDGRSIPAYYSKPKAASSEQPVPVVVIIHGGPESQYRPTFSPFDQYLLNELGVAVIHPNVRGSNGYGKSYLLLDNGPKREDSVRDIGGLLDWIAMQPELDASRVAVSGGSYGGYMVLASLTHFPDKIRAGIDNVGIASFTTFLKNTSDYRRDLRRAEYGDERDPEMAKVFERINPTNNAHRIKSALLVAHGKNDPRVPFSEAEQIAPIVRKNGVDVWTIYADNEGHGFGKQDNREYLLAAEILFLRHHLLGDK